MSLLRQEDDPSAWIQVLGTAKWMPRKNAVFCIIQCYNLLYLATKTVLKIQMSCLFSRVQICRKNTQSKWLEVGRSGCSFFLLTHLTFSTSWLLIFFFILMPALSVFMHFVFCSITRLTRNLNKPRGEKKINHLLNLRFKSNKPNKAYWCKPKCVKRIQGS